MICFLSLDFCNKLYYFQEESSGNDINPGAPLDSDLDAQLDSLRKKLAEVIMVLIVKFFIMQNWDFCLFVYLDTNFAVRWGKSLKC